MVVLVQDIIEDKQQPWAFLAIPELMVSCKDYSHLLKALQHHYLDQ